MKISVRQGFREEHRGGGRITLIANTNHLNGALQLSLSYEFGEKNFVNQVACVEVTPIYPKQNKASATIDLFPDNTIITGIETALRYFEYATKYLSGTNRTHPASFQNWLDSGTSAHQAR